MRTYAFPCIFARTISGAHGSKQYLCYPRVGLSDAGQHEAMRCSTHYDFQKLHHEMRVFKWGWTTTPSERYGREGWPYILCSRIHDTGSFISREAKVKVDPSSHIVVCIPFGHYIYLIMT